MSPIMGLIYLLIVIVAAAVIVVVARKKLLGKRKDPELLKDGDSDSDSLFEEDGEDAALEEPIPVAPAPVPVSQTVKKTLGRLYIQEKGKSYPDIHVPLKDGRQQEVPDLYLCQSGFTSSTAWTWMAAGSSAARTAGGGPGYLPGGQGLL